MLVKQATSQTPRLSGYNPHRSSWFIRVPSLSYGGWLVSGKLNTYNKKPYTAKDNAHAIRFVLVS